MELVLILFVQVLKSLKYELKYPSETLNYFVRYFNLSILSGVTVLCF